MVTTVTIEYCGFTVKENADGWVVVDRHGCNPVPGAMVASDKDGAIRLIDLIIASGGSADDEFMKSGINVPQFHALNRLTR